jgi:predicted TIM-barrel fold metal-dependent hydrolase
MENFAGAQLGSHDPAESGSMDLDGHEFSPPHLWEGIFGPAAGQIATICAPFLEKMGEDYILMPALAGDDMAMTEQNVWNTRSVGAPGAFDMGRRLRALDLMKVRSQLIFPSYGLLAQILATAGDGGGAQIQVLKSMGGGLTVPEMRKLGLAGVAEYNDWACATTALDRDRLRAVGMLGSAPSISALVDEAKSLIDRGIRALMINIGSPPAGVSPAHPDFDPFWALLAERQIPLAAHAGGDLGFLQSLEWSNAPAFAAGKQSFEVGLEPYSYSTVHLGISHWISVLVMGGVFERHPTLRFAAVELGAHWFGPLATALDMWAEKVFARRLAPFLKMKPSEYMARNIRVTPFNIVEPVDEFFVNYPHLADCYCYSTDYPHVEGGKDIYNKVREMLSPLGDEIMNKYFVSNSSLIMPD